jgi:hypothetical protein
MHGWLIHNHTVSIIILNMFFILMSMPDTELASLVMTHVHDLPEGDDAVADYAGPLDPGKRPDFERGAKASEPTNETASRAAPLAEHAASGLDPLKQSPAQV